MHSLFFLFTAEDGNDKYSQDDLDNRSRQLNDQDDRYYQSRGQDGRPDSK